MCSQAAAASPLRHFVKITRSSSSVDGFFTAAYCSRSLLNLKKSDLSDGSPLNVGGDTSDPLNMFEEEVVVRLRLRFSSIISVTTFTCSSLSSLAFSSNSRASLLIPASIASLLRRFASALAVSTLLLKAFSASSCLRNSAWSIFSFTTTFLSSLTMVSISSMALLAYLSTD